MTSSTTNYVPLITSLGAKVSSFSVELATKTTVEEAVEATYQSMQASLGRLSNQAILATATDSQVIASASAAVGEYNVTLKEIFDARNQYGEIPSIGGNLTYLVIFAVLLLAQSTISFWYKQWWLLVAMLCGLALETMGFLGRFLSHNDATMEDYFLLQIITLTIAPAFIMGGIYILLGKFIVVYGPKFALMRPILYSYLFMTCDFISLVIQAIGGALAASADTQKDNEAGTHIMVGGLAFQVLSMSIYSSLFLHFFWKIKAYNREKHLQLEYSGKFNQNPDYIRLRSRLFFKLFPIAVALAVFFVYIRCVYRLIELIQGWNGYLITHEIYMFFLDALMIALASGILLIFHPGVAFNSRKVKINVVGTKRSGKTKHQERLEKEQGFAGNDDDDEESGDQQFDFENQQTSQLPVEYDAQNPNDSDEKPDGSYEECSLQGKSTDTSTNVGGTSSDIRNTEHYYRQFTDARDDSWKDIRHASERRDFTQ